MRHHLPWRVDAPCLLVAVPADEMLGGFGEHASLEARACLLRRRVVHFLEHSRHAQQQSGLELAQVGEQVMCVADIADHAIAAHHRVLDVAGEAMGKWQEQQQSRGLGATSAAHDGQHVVAVLDDGEEVAAGEHDALGLAGGSGRVDDGGDVIGVHRADGFVQRGVIDGVAEVLDRFDSTCEEVEHIPQPRLVFLAHGFQRMGSFIAHAERHGGIHGACEGRCLGWGIGFVDGHADRADRIAGVIHEAPFVAGGRVDDDAVALAHAQPQEAFGDGAHGFVHLAGGDVLPLPAWSALESGDVFVRGLRRPVNKQRINRVGIRRGGDGGNGDFTQHTHKFIHLARSCFVGFANCFSRCRTDRRSSVRRGAPISCSPSSSSPPP